MTPEPFEEFRYSGCGTSSHSLQPIVLCLWLLLSFNLELQLCLASETVGVISLGTAVGDTLLELENSTILSGPRAVLNDDEGGLCLWPPGV